MELVGAYSNKLTLRDQYAELLKLVQTSPPRPPKPAPTGHTKAPKRPVDRAEIDQIIATYQSGFSTNYLAHKHRLAKRTISALLRANGVTLRQRGGRPRPHPDTP